MRLMMTPSLERLGIAASERGVAIYNVGGAVRDRLLGYESADDDLAGPEKPEGLAKLHLTNTTILDPVNGLGTALIQEGPADDRHTYEYTAFRVDSYAGEHRPAAIAFTEDIHKDALRRDFTINALYARLPNGAVEDPTGRGLKDLENGLIRMTRPETMAEDALRILRMIRFAAALGFQVEEETYAAAKASASRLKTISKERIAQEFFKILLGDTTYGKEDAVGRALYMMRDLGVFEYVLPELLEGRGFEQSTRYHRYDVLDHQIETCIAAPPDLTTRLAALLHDISKPEAYARNGNMYDHAARGAVKAGKALGRLKAPRRLTGDVSELVANHMFDLENKAKRKAVLKRLNQLGDEQFLRLADLREADFKGSGMNQEAASAAKWRQTLKELQEKDAPFSVSDLAISGNDLMRELHLEPGPLVGELLGRLLEHVQMRPSQNNYKSLAKYAKILAAGTAGAGRSASEPSNGGPKGV